MRGRLAGALAILVLLGGLSPSATAQRKTKQEREREQQLVRGPDDQQIDKAISEMLAAWQIGDVELLHKYYAEDVTVVSGAFEPPLFGWPRFAQAYQAQRARPMMNVRLERQNTVVRYKGMFAWAAYQWEFSALVDDRPISAVGHTTLLLEKQKDRWVIVHNHTSAVQSATPTPPAGASQPGKPGN